MSGPQIVVGSRITGNVTVFAPKSEQENPRSRPSGVTRTQPGPQCLFLLENTPLTQQPDTLCQWGIVQKVRPAYERGNGTSRMK